MSFGEFIPADGTDHAPWHWYVLIGYPALNLLGIVSITSLTGGGSIIASSLATITLLIVLTAAGVFTIPAISRDIDFVRTETDAWEPDRDVYVGSAIAAPLALGLLSGLAAGFGVAIAMTIVTFLLSTVTVCVVYLFNRHRTIGLLAR